VNTLLLTTALRCAARRSGVERGFEPQTHCQTLRWCFWFSNEMNESPRATTRKKHEHARGSSSSTRLRDGEHGPGAAMTRARSSKSPASFPELAFMSSRLAFPRLQRGRYRFRPGNRSRSQRPRQSADWRVACPMDIDAAGPAIKPAGKKRIHSSLSRSKLPMPQVQTRQGPERNRSPRPSIAWNWLNPSPMSSSSRPMTLHAQPSSTFS